MRNFETEQVAGREQNLSVVDFDFSRDFSRLVVLDRSHLYWQATDAGLPADRRVGPHSLRNPSAVCYLLGDAFGSLCAVADQDADAEGSHWVSIFSLELFMPVARLRHALCPPSQLFSLRNEEGLLSASQQSVCLWRPPGTSPLEPGAFPRVIKQPLVLAKPAVEVELADCFFKSAQAAFVSVDRLGLGFHITRPAAPREQGAAYTSHFYLFDRVADGYSHSLAFTAPAPLDSVHASADGLLLIGHTVKHEVVLVDTHSGGLVACLH